VRFRRLSQASWRAVLNSIAVILLTQGANLIQQGDYLSGGGICFAGFILFLIANYA